MKMRYYGKKRKAKITSKKGVNRSPKEEKSNLKI